MYDAIHTFTPHIYWRIVLRRYLYSRIPGNWEMHASLACCIVSFCRNIIRNVATLTIPGGQEFHVSHFSSNFHNFVLFLHKLSSFCHHLAISSLWVGESPTWEVPGNMAVKSTNELQTKHYNNIYQILSLFLTYK